MDMRKAVIGIAGLMLAAGAGAARADEGILRSAGPRFGVVYVASSALQSKLREHHAEPVLTAWGWQFEYEYLNTEGGTTGLFEFVPLAVGLESGMLVPSGTLLLGVRLAGGFELGFGPNVTAVTRAGKPDAATGAVGKDRVGPGVGMSAAIGFTASSGRMNFPVNLALIRNENGFRLGLVLGWHRSKRIQ